MCQLARFGERYEPFLGPNDKFVLLAINAEDTANKPIRITAGGGPEKFSSEYAHDQGKWTPQLQTNQPTVPGR
jgi:hypothetical protein